MDSARRKSIGQKSFTKKVRVYLNWPGAHAAKKEKLKSVLISQRKRSIKNVSEGLKIIWLEIYETKKRSRYRFLKKRIVVNGKCLLKEKIVEEMKIIRWPSIKNDAWFKKYDKLEIKKRITRVIRESYRKIKNLSIELSLTAKLPFRLFFTERKVTKELSARLMRWKILRSFAKSSVFVRRGGLRYKLFNALSLEFTAAHFAKLKYFLEIINYLKIQKLKISAKGESARGGKNYFSKTFLKRAVAVATVLIVLVNVYIQNSEYSSGATFTFDQTQWRATPTGGNAAHPGDQSSFTDYTSKDANISLTGGAGPYDSATISSSSSSNTQTADADFNAGTTSQTTVASDSVTLAPEPGGFGDGGDGAWTISSAININTDTNGNGGRTCADGISYNVTELTANMATLSGTPPAGCYSAGDQVMLLNEQGDGTNLTNVGNYEFLEVQSITGNLITFTTNKTKYYGGGASNDLLGNWQSASIASNHSLAVQTNGTLWSWGNNSNGRLGQGDTTQRTTPTQVGSLTTWQSVATGWGGHSVATQTDGTLWGWGRNDFFQLGLGDITQRTSPVQIGSGTDWQSVAAGGVHTFAIKTSGTLWTWGYNGNGQLGIGNYDNKTTPFQVGSDTNWQSIYTKNNSTLAIKTDGTLWAWGQNANGQLGLGNTNEQTSPVQVGTDTDWLALSTGGDHTLAIKTNGTLWAWGNNANGRLGLGDTTQRTSPVQVGSGTDWQSVSAGINGHSMAIKTGGTLWAWGNNANGRLGLGDTTQRTSPVQVGTLTTWGSVVAGYYDTLAIKNDGTQWAWGYNNAYQLGLGDTTQRTSPTGTNYFQKIIIQRIPQYTNVTIQSGGSLTADAWNGTKGGVLAFYASGTVDVQSGGSINVNEKGYRNVGSTGAQGESYNSIGGISSAANLGGGGGAYSFDGYCTTIDDGAGGGYGTVGSTAGYAAGGGTYGNANLSQLLLGSAGGRGSPGAGSGGGINYIKASSINVGGNIANNGANGAGFGGGGAGSGGSTYLTSDSLTLGTSLVTAQGGSGASYYEPDCSSTYTSGAGGVGRIHLKSNSIAGTTAPTADTSSLPTTYYSSGTFTSSAIDVGQKMVTGTFNWSDTIPGDSSITMEARGAVASGDVAGKSWCSITKGASIFSLATSCVETNSRYVQYRATLNSTSDQLSTPSLNDATLSYTYYPTGQTIISSWYNTTDSANLLSKVIWDENSSMPSGTTIEFQAQTAPDSSGSPGTGTGFVGPDGTSGTYFSNADGNCSKVGQTVTCNVPSSIQIGDGTDDQWIAYKAYFNSDGANAPQLDSAKLQYVVNGSPTVSNATASENASGVLNIAYDVDDVDNATQTISFGINTGVTLADNPLTSGATTINLSGNYSNLPTSTQTIQIDQEQMTCTTRAGAVLSTCTRAANNTRASTHAQNSVVWFVSTAGNVSGDAGAGVANGTGKSATWNIKADLSGVYNAAATLRVMANDGQLANQMSLASGAVSSTFPLDTKNPASPQITLDRSASADQITIGITDDSASGVEYALSFPIASVDGSAGSCDFTSPSWQSFTYPSQTVTIVDNNDDVRKACVLFRDAYGNTSSNIANFALTPQNPYAFQYYDVSNVGIGDYRLFLSWGVPEDTAEGKESGANGFSQYEVQRCSDNKDNPNCSPSVTYETIVSKLENSLTDTESGLGLDPDLRYCYRFRIKDSNSDPSGDFSKWSSTICAVPGSGTSSITKNVSIHWYDTSEENVPSDQVYTTQATIKWQTVNAADPGEAILSDSTVWWRVLGSSEWTESYSVSSYVEDHIITIPGRLSPGTTYEYRVTSTTPWAATDTQNGTTPATFTTKLGPVIRNVQTVSVGNTNAAVEWDTEDQNGDPANASSIVYYSVALDSNGDLVAPQTGNCPGGYSTHHACTMTDLTSGLPYYYYVYSVLETDPDAYSADTNGGEFYRFTTTTDTTPPLITPDAGNPLILTDTQAALSFDTNERSESWLLFDTTTHAGASFPAGDFDPDNPAHNPYSDYLSGATSSNLSHTFVFSLDSLAPDTTYFYRFVSEDISGNASAGTEASFTTLTTQVDQHDPLGSISTPADANTDDSADITRGPAYAYVTWTTDEVANQSLDCSLIQGGPYTISTSDLVSYNEEHTLKLPNLAADTQYWCQVTSEDDLTPANSLTSSEFSFTTLPNPEFQHDPLSEITDISDPPAVLTDTKAVIKFNTDQSAQCAIEYGTESGNYAEVPITEGLYNFEHSMHMTGLIFSTPYFYQIICADNLDNSVSSSEYTFTTSEQLFTSGEWGAQGDTTPPVISNVKAGTLTGESVTLTWDTDEEASSSVAFGITSGTYEGMASNYLVNSDTANYVTEHSVVINGLIPATKYYFKAMSTDISGNIVESAESSFTTASPSSLSSIKVISKNLNEATVTWETSKETTSVLEYGLTTAYGESKTSNQLAKLHEITISKLTSAQTYHLRVKGKDEDNNWFASADYTFEPKSPPQVSSIRIVDVTEHEAKIQFNTNIPTDALITYTDPNNNQNSGSQGKPDLMNNHEVVLKNLAQGTTFSLSIKVRDADGNETDQEAQNFTTGKDENPPQVDQLRTDSALTQNDNVQTIISWATDELASTELIYKEGKGGQEKEVTISENKTLNHVAVITTFKAGTVYYFKAKSVDQADNEGISNEYALLTPKRKENVIQLIINNFEQIFGWAKR